ncbi:hypothetical protein Y032_0109g121 [Ancylostoma ceylanicum]|uniref:Uncharacterized protein n=1 Tax=Ancylostoma ceylanicum TaxID=53326 RepID=A0A016TES3_9BILA|nr:hypothetical protein Y032_0109g121 [Ancylostoma ceylanicum]
MNRPITAQQRTSCHATSTRANGPQPLESPVLTLISTRGVIFLIENHKLALTRVAQRRRLSRLIHFLLPGLVIYFIYGIHNSKEGKKRRVVPESSLSTISKNNSEKN